METAVTRNLSQIDAQLKELNSSIKSCAADSKSLDKALKLDSTNLGLAATKTNVLKDQVELVRQKLEALRAKQAEYDRQIAAGLPVDQAEYRSLQVQIAATESQVTTLSRETKTLNSANLDTLKNQFSGVSRVAKALLAAIAAVGVAFAAESETIANSSSALNVSAETYQKWANVFEKTTGDASDYSDVMGSLTTVLAGISKGSSKSEGALASLGLTMDDLKGKSPEEAMNLILTALSNVADETQRTVLATALLGDSGSSLAKVAGLTAAEIATLNSAFESTGMLTNSQVASGKELSDTFKDLKNQFMVVVAQLGTALMPTFQAFAKILEGIAPILGSVANGLQAIGPAGQVAVVGGIAFLAILPGLITGIVSLKAALDFLSANPVMLAVAAVVAGAAIGVGAAILTNGVSSAASPSSYTAGSTSDNSVINITLTGDSGDTADETADKVAAAVVAAKKQRGQI